MRHFKVSVSGFLAHENIWKKAHTRAHTRAHTCTRAWKIFRICFWMRTEKIVASTRSWLMSCWILGRKICMAASNGSLSSAFLYLKHTHAWYLLNDLSSNQNVLQVVDVILLQLLDWSRECLICFCLYNALLVWENFFKWHYTVIWKRATKKTPKQKKDKYP